LPAIEKQKSQEIIIIIKMINFFTKSTKSALGQNYFWIDMDRRICDKIFKNAIAMRRHFCPKAYKIEGFI
jgi:hypothetical protein